MGDYNLLYSVSLSLFSPLSFSLSVYSSTMKLLNVALSVSAFQTDKNDQIPGPSPSSSLADDSKKSFGPFPSPGPIFPGNSSFGPFPSPGPIFPGNSSVPDNFDMESFLAQMELVQDFADLLNVKCSTNPDVHHTVGAFELTAAETTEVDCQVGSKGKFSCEEPGKVKTVSPCQAACQTDPKKHYTDGAVELTSAEELDVDCKSGYSTSRGPQGRFTCTDYGRVRSVIPCKKLKIGLMR